MGIAVGILSILMALVMGALNSLGFIGAAISNDVKLAKVTVVGSGLSLRTWSVVPLLLENQRLQGTYSLLLL